MTCISVMPVKEGYPAIDLVIARVRCKPKPSPASKPQSLRSPLAFLEMRGGMGMEPSCACAVAP